MIRIISDVSYRKYKTFLLKSKHRFYHVMSLKSVVADTGINVTDKKTVGFQQIALNAEAVSNSWTLNGYGLIPEGGEEDGEE